MMSSSLSRQVKGDRLKGDTLNLPQFDGHFEKEYTMKQRGVSNEKEADIFTGV